MQFFGQERTSKLIKSSTDIVTLLAGSIARVGGHVANLTSTLALNRTVSGFGGIDFGAVANLTFYYVYLVHNGTTFGLVASTSATSPTGFSNYKKIGAFYTDSTGLIFKAYWYGEINHTVISAYITDGAGVGTATEQTPETWISGVVNGSAGSYIVTLLSTIFSQLPHAWISTISRRDNSCAPTSLTQINITLSLNGSVLDSDFQIYAKKRGVDAIQPDWTV